MADVTELGQRARPLRIVLTAQGFGAAMRARFHPSLPEWPEGTTIALVLTHKGNVWSWPADLDGSLISWSVDPTETSVVPAGADASVVVRLPGRPPIEWFNGAVVRP